MIENYNDIIQFETQIRGDGRWPTHIPGGYYLVNTIITVCDGTNDYHFYGYKAGAAPEFQEYEDDDGRSNFSPSGRIAFDAWGAQREVGQRSWIDNVRIIPESGAYFESESLPSPAFSDDVSWGTITGTVTLSSGGNYASEIVYFQTKTDGYWSPASGDTITSSDSTSIQYRADFTTLDNSSSGLGTLPYFSETIALEDITITYLLPATKILYCTNVCF